MGAKESPGIDRAPQRRPPWAPRWIVPAAAACAMAPAIALTVHKPTTWVESAPWVAQAGNAKPAPAAAETSANSSMDGSLFYQLLIGEIQLRQGQSVAAFELVLDAARRTRNDQLFRRASDIALQARAGDRALSAARAWRTARPESLEAIRLQVQLLAALNRIDDVAEPLQALLRQTPASERVDLILSLPRFFQRASDARQVARMLQTALNAATNEPGTRVAALTTLGRSWWRAEDASQAADLIRRAHEADPGATGPVLASLEMLGQAPQLESVVRQHLAHPSAGVAVRMAYARSLTQSQRLAEAVEQAQVVTRLEPGTAPAWLMLGALHVELREARAAEEALRRYLALQGAETRAPAPARQEGAESGAEADTVSDSDDDSNAAGLSQAWLLMAQAAEIRQDYAAAEAYLGRIDNPEQLLEVQTRRASLLVRQGRLEQARALVRQVPVTGEEGERSRLQSEARLLREAKRWQDAFELLGQASARWPQDADLLYEQSMMAEKLDRMDEMERLLKRVIELRPNHGHAHNALGYSLADRNLRLPEARALIVRALELQPGDPFITDSLGWVEFRMGRIDEALRLLQEAYGKRPDAEIAAHLGEVLWVAGRRDDARRIWREGRERDPDNEVLRITIQRLSPGL